MIEWSKQITEQTCERSIAYVPITVLPRPPCFVSSGTAHRSPPLRNHVVMSGECRNRCFTWVHYTVGWNCIGAFNSKTRTFLPWAPKRVSEQASKRANEIRRTRKRSGREEQAGEWCKCTSEQTSEWPNTLRVNFISYLLKETLETRSYKRAVEDAAKSAMFRQLLAFFMEN